MNQRLKFYLEAFKGKLLSNVPIVKENKHYNKKCINAGLKFRIGDTKP